MLRFLVTLHGYIGLLTTIYLCSEQPLCTQDVFKKFGGFMEIDVDVSFIFQGDLSGSPTMDVNCVG